MKKRIWIPIILVAAFLVMLSAPFSTDSQAYWNFKWDNLRKLLERAHTWTGTQTFSGGIDGVVGGTTPVDGSFTTLSSTGQYTNTLASGTAPLVISSTTIVPNMNVDLLDDKDWASPAAIGTSTPAAAIFTTWSSPAFALTPGTTIDIDLSQGNNFTVTLAENSAFTISNPVDGAPVTLRVVQDGGGSNVPTFSTAFHFPGGVTPTFTGTGGGIDRMRFVTVTTILENDGFAADVKQ